MSETEIQDRVIEAETAAREATVQNILTDLRDFLSTATEAERAGYLAAIQVIESNY